jgi:hypothetical protein
VTQLRCDLLTNGEDTVVTSRASAAKLGPCCKTGATADRMSDVSC